MNNSDPLEWYRRFDSLADRTPRWMNHSRSFEAELAKDSTGGADRVPLDLLDLLLSKVDRKKFRKVLDVGCGRGGALARLAREGPGFLMGIDPVIGNAICTGSTAAFAVGGVAENMPFRCGTFDLTYSIEAVHLFRPPEAGLLEMARVTRPGGAIVLADGMDSRSKFPLAGVVERGLARIELETDITQDVTGWLMRGRRSLEQHLSTAMTGQPGALADEFKAGAFAAIDGYILPGLESGRFAYRLAVLSRS